MRNIKFRAFVDGKMYPVTNLDYIQDGSGIIAHIHVKGINQEIPSGQFELMQYTGLTDENGQEIYEGDLLRRPTVNRTIYLVDFNDENYGWLMGWNLLEYGIIDDKNNLSEFDKVQWSNNKDVVDYPVKSYYYGSSPDEHYEVVGNIFEGIDK